MINTSPDALKKIDEIANRNIANGNWGTEFRLPNEAVPMSDAERIAADARDIPVKDLKK